MIKEDRIISELEEEKEATQDQKGDISSIFIAGYECAMEDAKEIVKNQERDIIDSTEIVQAEQEFKEKVVDWLVDHKKHISYITIEDRGHHLSYKRYISIEMQECHPPLPDDWKPYKED